MGLLVNWLLLNLWLLAHELLRLLEDWLLLQLWLLVYGLLILIIDGNTKTLHQLAQVCALSIDHLHIRELLQDLVEANALSLVWHSLLNHRFGLLVLRQN